MKTRPWIDVSELSQPTDPNAQDAIDSASFILFVLSGEKYSGLFEVTEQYVCETTGAPLGCWWDAGMRAYWNPALGAYTYLIDPFRDSLRPTRLVPGSMIRLQRTPVKEIVSVSINGASAASGDYELLNGSILNPTNATWDLFSGPVVTYRYGVEPPALGRIAAKKLADELVVSLQGGVCDLPSNITSIARQGVSYQLISESSTDQGLSAMKTGIYEVDLFLSTANPGKAKKRPRVFSPDMRRPYRR